MGLIRSKNCNLTPESSDEDLTCYLWPILAEIIKTNIENKQNLIIEGCYIPFDYQKSFDDGYLQHIKYICLIFSKKYIETHFDSIQKNSNIIESRITCENLTQNQLIYENEYQLEQSKKYGCDYILIDDRYEVNFDL